MKTPHDTVHESRREEREEPHSEIHRVRKSNYAAPAFKSALNNFSGFNIAYSSGLP
jgi:hypothetical protein